jgi:hypothetical protein
MGTTQESSLYSYLYLKLAKCHVSLFLCFSFYVFFSTKLKNRRVEQVLEEVAGKGVGG